MGHIDKVPQVRAQHHLAFHAERKQHPDILTRQLHCLKLLHGNKDLIHRMLINCLRFFICPDLRRCYIRKALLIIDIAGRSLQSRRASSDMGIQLPDHPCGISFQDQICLRILPRSSVTVCKTAHPALIVLGCIRDISAPADTCFTSDQTDRILCCFFLYDDPSHILSGPFLLLFFSVPAIGAEPAPVDPYRFDHIIQPVETQ